MLQIMHSRVLIQFAKISSSFFFQPLLTYFVKLLQFLYLVKEIPLVIFSVKKTDVEDSIRLYNKSGPSCKKLFATITILDSPISVFFSSILASLSHLFFLASSLLFSISSKLKLTYLDHCIKDQYAKLVVFFIYWSVVALYWYG